MNIITLPPGLPMLRQSFGFRTNDMTFGSTDAPGPTQTVVVGPTQRTCSLVSEDRIPVAAEIALWTAFVHAIGGKVNPVAISNLMQPAPLGTARGAWSAASLAPAGAATLSLSLGAEQAGRTVLQGDWMGVNQVDTNRQLLHVQESATADAQGLITLLFAPVLRVAVPAGTTVVWDRPTCLMKHSSSDNSWQLQTRTAGSFSLDFVEWWR